MKPEVAKRREIRAAAKRWPPMMALRAIIIVSFALLAASGVRAGSLDSSVLGMFPSDISEFGYADLSAVRDSPWFPQFEAQMVPVALYGFEQLLQAAQMQQEPVLQGVAWAQLSSETRGSTTERSEPGSGQLVGVAQGHFNRDAIRTFLNSKQIQGIPVEDEVMYGAGTGSGSSDVFFILVSDQTIAFGSEDGLKRMLRVAAGEEENLLTNDRMMEPIGEVNGDGVFWGVFGGSGTQAAVQQVFPDVSKFQQGRELISKVKVVSIAVKMPSDIEVAVEVTAGSPSDALLLSQLLQVGLLYREQQSSQRNSEVNQILAGARVSADGNHLNFSLRVNDDQVLSLIEHDAFRMPM